MVFYEDDADDDDGDEESGDYKRELEQTPFGLSWLRSGCSWENRPQAGFNWSSVAP